MRIYYHPRFARSYKTLFVALQKKAERKEAIFRKNPFDPGLKTHKLHGKLKNQWSFSVDQNHRILFEFEEGDVIFLDIGDHDIYQ